MDIEKLASKKMKLKNTFDFHELFSIGKEVMFKEEYKQLMSEAITSKVITIDKLILAENVAGELDSIIHTKDDAQLLLNWLKSDQDEFDYITAPIIYLLKKLDPKFKCKRHEEDRTFISDVIQLKVRPIIDKTNAVPRLFFPKHKIAVTSTNDDIASLVDILSVKNIIQVYVVGTDDYCEDVIVYKINRIARYFEVVEGFKDELYEKYGSDIRNIKI